MFSDFFKGLFDELRPSLVKLLKLLIGVVLLIFILLPVVAYGARFAGRQLLDAYDASVETLNAREERHRAREKEGEEFVGYARVVNVLCPKVMYEPIPKLEKSVTDTNWIDFVAREYGPSTVQLERITTVEEGLGRKNFEYCKRRVRPGWIIGFRANGEFAAMSPKDAREIICANLTGPYCPIEEKVSQEPDEQGFPDPQPKSAPIIPPQDGADVILPDPKKEQKKVSTFDPDEVARKLLAAPKSEDVPDVKIAEYAP